MVPMSDSRPVGPDQVVNGSKLKSSRRKSIFGLVLGVSCILISFVVVSFRVGGFSNGLLLINGQRVFPDSVVVELGDVDGGSIVNTAVIARNYSSSVRRITGMRSDCTCVSVTDLPVDILGKSACPIAIRVHVTNRSGSLNHTIQFFTDDGGLRSFNVCVKGNILLAEDQ
jgi:hypothetical protein